LRPWYWFCKSLAYGLAKLLWGLRVEGLENVPRSGALLVTSNHISNLDPPVLGSVVPRETGFAAKRELFAVPVLSALIRSLNSIPVDRTQLSLSTLRTMGEFLTREQSLLIFPEGTRGEPGRFRSPKTGVGMILSKYPAQVLPAYVEGTDQPWRNLFRRGRVRVAFGRPYTLPKEAFGSGSRREQYRRVAELVMEHIRRLREESPNDDAGGGVPGR
jgi:1-acyl-sn-glycerol-3-phosphate acyltransferase